MRFGRPLRRFCGAYIDLKSTMMRMVRHDGTINSLKIVEIRKIGNRCYRASGPTWLCQWRQEGIAQAEDMRNRGDVPASVVIRELPPNMHRSGGLVRG